MNYRLLFLWLSLIFAVVGLSWAMAEFFERHLRRRSRWHIDAPPFRDERDSITSFRRMFPREDR